MTAQEQHLQAEILKLKKENELMRKLATTEGFYQYYFSQLPFFSSNLDCFNHINETYYNFFNEYKYSSYDSFKKLKNKFLKK